MFWFGSHVGRHKTLSGNTRPSSKEPRNLPAQPLMWLIHEIFHVGCEEIACRDSRLPSLRLPETEAKVWGSPVLFFPLTSPAGVTALLVSRHPKPHHNKMEDFFAFRFTQDSVQHDPLGAVELPGIHGDGDPFEGQRTWDKDNEMRKPARMCTCQGTLPQVCK